MTNKLDKIRNRRKARVRAKISGTAERPRLSVFRSAKNIFVQAIADDSGRTLAEASTLCKEVKKDIVGLKKVDAARVVGKLLSKRLKAIGIEKAVFDRGRYLYHGRVQALAEGAREEGLHF